MKKLKILIVENDLSSRALLQSSLSESSLPVSEVKYTESLNDAFGLLDKDSFDVVLLDLNLPDSRGLDTLVRMSEKCPLIAKVVLTGQADEDLGLEAIKKGAQEHLILDRCNVYSLTKYILYAIGHKQAEQVQMQLLSDIEQANKELKNFAFTVSHDLKAPLRAIKALANWISTDYADKLNENGKEQIELLLTRVDQMNNLINGVLQYSRLGCAKEKPDPVDLNQVVSEVIDMVIPSDNITITIENRLPVVEFEETRIMQVFQNLLTNAVKYMDKPEGKITIDCVEEADFWKFSVADNGPGIKERYFEKIFQIFQTVSPHHGLESSGVGLAVVKKIVELYGGKIWVESQIGRGSTFFFTLPKQKTQTKYAKLETNILSRG
ncbi:MAG: sensor histidine kinase [Planctomycetota bacterium]|jgi:light-regulated signal transduction histidine kinase (bacteriophytochrome)